MSSLGKPLSDRQAWDEHLRWVREWETRFWEAQERRYRDGDPPNETVIVTEVDHR